MKLVYRILLQTALLLFTNGSAATDDSTDSAREELIGACPIKLKSSGECDGEECPYRITLPPMTIQLPKQFRLIERTLKEVQNLKEVVNKMKKSCEDCNNEFLPPGTDAPVDNSKIQDNRVKELQNKVSRLSASLKNAKNQIHSLQNQLEHMNLINMNNVESYVDSKVANLTFAVNNLDNKCSSNCPATQPQPGFNNVWLGEPSQMGGV
uniref:Fibrinogen like 2 n=1 Tax=Podarcis muralis TaxID=64176 RepID=A0A670J673_PODMU